MMNIVFLAKLGWRLLNEKDSFWAKVLSGKYIRNTLQLDHTLPKQGTSNAWRFIVKAKDILKRE